MKITVIGAGVFGLASAIELASRGHEVSVFERGVTPNPNASSTDVERFRIGDRLDASHLPRPEGSRGFALREPASG